ETSFAQFQADRSVVGLARRARELEDTAADYRAAVTCERGDLLEYAGIQEAITEREKTLSRARAERDRDRTRSGRADLRRAHASAGRCAWAQGCRGRSPRGRSLAPAPAPNATAPGPAACWPMSAAAT